MHATKKEFIGTFPCRNYFFPESLADVDCSEAFTNCGISQRNVFFWTEKFICHWLSGLAPSRVD